MKFNKSPASSCYQKISSPVLQDQARRNCVLDPCTVTSMESNDSDSDECSVGSCSVVIDNPNQLWSRILEAEADTFSSDAESFNGHENEEEKCSLSLEKNVAVGIHSLELHAYRCTLEALYASGPLNWEQEVLLTNLRISLNISNDEHLMELRHLISAGTSIHFR